jgi:hypothetical protein
MLRVVGKLLVGTSSKRAAPRTGFGVTVSLSTAGAAFSDTLATPQPTGKAPMRSQPIGEFSGAHGDVTFKVKSSVETLAAKLSSNEHDSASFHPAESILSKEVHASWKSDARWPIARWRSGAPALQLMRLVRAVRPACKRGRLS